MSNEYVRVKGRPAEILKSTYQVGIDQERLIKKIIVDVAQARLGTGDTTSLHEQNMRERMTWRTDSRIWTVNWYRPNTHPILVGELHVPDFDFWLDDRRLANLESKNWKQDYLPLSLSHTNEKIFSRVAGRAVELGNILVISELHCEVGDEQEILNLLREHKFKVLLTNRKTKSPDDEDMYRIIRNMLEPILIYIFNHEGPRPDWALLLIEPKSSSTVLVLSRTPPSHIESTVYQYYGLRAEYGLPIIQSTVMHCMVLYGMRLEECGWPQPYGDRWAASLRCMGRLAVCTVA